MEHMAPMFFALLLSRIPNSKNGFQVWSTVTRSVPTEGERVHFDQGTLQKRKRKMCHGPLTHNVITGPRIGEPWGWFQSLEPLL